MYFLDLHRCVIGTLPHVNPDYVPLIVNILIENFEAYKEGWLLSGRSPGTLDEMYRFLKLHQLKQQSPNTIEYLMTAIQSVISRTGQGAFNYNFDLTSLDTTICSCIGNLPEGDNFQFRAPEDIKVLCEVFAAEDIPEDLQFMK